MSPELPPTNTISPGPSTKNWLLLLSLLTGLLLAGSPGHRARPAAAAAPASERRLALTPAPRPVSTTFAAAIAL